MDYLESLGKQLSEVTVYDLKTYYNQAKNMVMNYTEMEAKVREATNDDAWGASSTLMKEIADGTQNFQLFNEIMPTIYKRFTEKEASEWRQIYKALQLLEYLVKHGSERVVDDARQHVSMIKMLRNFHYTDEKGKDQGINVRNRAKELAELLGDLDRVRQERKKARANKTKYGGIGNDGFRSGGGGGMGMGSGSSRYGGFGSESLGYEDNSSSSFADDRHRSSFRDPAPRKESFEEYDAGEWDDRATSTSSTKRTSTARATSKPVPEAPKPLPKKEVNLFDWDEDEPAASTSTGASVNMPSQSSSLDDDFDDFQSAVPATSPTSVNVKANASSAKPNFFDLMNAGPTTAPNAAASARPIQTPMSSTSPAPTPSYTSFNSQQQRQTPISSASVMAPSSQNKPGSSLSSGAGAFDDLWSMAGGSSKSSTTFGNSTGKSIADLAKQKTNSQIWSSSAANGRPSQASASSAFSNDDNLLL